MSIRQTLVGLGIENDVLSLALKVELDCGMHFRVHKLNDLFKLLQFSAASNADDINDIFNKICATMESNSLSELIKGIGLYIHSNHVADTLPKLLPGQMHAHNTSFNTGHQGQMGCVA